MARQDYVLDGSRQFVFPFPVADATDMRLQLFPGTTVPQEDYTVTGAGPASQGVTITWPDAPTDPDVVLTISRQTPPERVSDFPNNQAVSARALNAEFDTIYQILDELGLSAEDILALIDQDTGQLIQLDNDDVGTVSPVLPTAQALNLLSWNSDGTSIMNRTLADIQDEAGNPVLVGTEDDEVPTNTDINGRGFAQSVDSVSSLRTSTFPASLERLWLSGYYGVGTAGGGPLYRDADDTTSDDNGGTVFVDADGVRWKRPPQEEYTLYDFGGQTSSDDNLDVFQAALEEGQGVFRVKVPKGTWFIQGTIRPPSNSVLVGEGWDSIITMPDSFSRLFSIIVTGTVSDPRENIRIENLKLDFNPARVDGVVEGEPDYEQESERSCLVVACTTNAWIKNIWATNPRLHAINVSGGTNARGGSDALTYSPEPSRYVWVEKCIAENFGDDGITTHMCTDVWISDCIARDGTAVVGGNCNGFEIDDGTRNCWVHNCEAYRCNAGLEIKGHPDTPAPYNVNVTGNFFSVNCNVSLQIRHIDFESGDPESETARNVFIDRFTSVSPRSSNAAFSAAIRHVRVTSYENVHINSLLCTNGSEDLTEKEFLPQGNVDEENMIWFFGQARNVYLGKVTLIGSAEAARGLFFSGSFEGDAYVEKYVSRDGPRRCFEASADAGTVTLQSYDIVGDHPETGGVAVVMLGDADAAGSFKTVGVGTQSGYSATLNWNGANRVPPIVGFPLGVRSTGTISGDD